MLHLENLQGMQAVAITDARTVQLISQAQIS
jgi:hypothetical protein